MNKVIKYYDPLNGAHYETFELKYDTDSVETAIKFVRRVSGRNAVKGHDGGVIWYNTNGERVVCNTGFIIYKSSKDKNEDYHIETKKFFEEMIEC